LIEKQTSGNGTRIVLEHMPAVRSVTIGIWVLTGSRNETAQNNGISHFLEHMFFKGTKKRSTQDIAEAFDSIGGQVNAFTSKEYTCFYAKVLDTYKSYALEILADMFFNTAFDEDEIAAEKKVVLEEIKMYEDTPDDIVHDLLDKASYGEHPLGYPILGTEDVINSFQPETLKNYINEQYTPDRIVISVAGNADASFIPEVEQYFGSFKRDSAQKKTEAPSFSSNRLVRTKDIEQAHLCLGFPGMSVANEDIYSLIIAENVLGGSMSSRLFQEIREKQGLAYTVFSFHAPFLDSGIETIYAGTSEDQLQVLGNTIERTLDRFVTAGLTDKELHNSKEQLKGELILSLESSSSRMSRNGRNELLLKRHRSLNEMTQSIDNVTQESVNKVIDSVFNQPHSTAIIAPFSSYR